MRAGFDSPRPHHPRTSDMRYFAILFPCLSVFFLSGCFSLKSDPNSSNGRVGGTPLRHVVLCWLKEPGNGEHRKQIMEVTKSFRGIPGVLDAQAGKAVASERSIVDDSFDVGILVVVENKEALEAYLRHPVHDDAKKKILLPLIDRLVVYDFQE